LLFNAPHDALEPFAIPFVALGYDQSPPRRRRRRPLPAVGSVINATTPARVVAP
jgi:hypothetical protein